MSKAAQMTQAAMSVTVDQIESLMCNAGQAGDRAQVAVCLVALRLSGLSASLTDLEDWERTCIEEARSALERLGIIPEHVDADVRAQSVCAAILAEVQS